MIPLVPTRRDREEEINDPADFRMPYGIYGLYDLQQWYYRYQRLSDKPWGNVVKPTYLRSW
jgi:hypothetical protein